MSFPTKETPEWIRELVINNEYEQNMSIMVLPDLFDRYLKECSYDEEEPDDESIDLEELDIDVKIDTDVKYEDIPEITFTQAKKLRNKKIETSLTKIEERQLEKYFFQCNIIVDHKVNQEQELWDIYCDYGKGTFRNLSYEKGYNDGSIRICDIINDVYPEISNILSLRVELIDRICDYWNQTLSGL